MATNTYAFAGSNLTQFVKASAKVYTTLNGGTTPVYVGRTEAEMTVTPAVETLEWRDNTTGVSVQVIEDIQQTDFSITFNFSQFTDENALAIALNMELDTTDPTNYILYGGSNPGSFQEAEWRFVVINRAGDEMTLIIPRGVISTPQEITLGSPGSWSTIGVTVKALQDTTETNTQRDLYRFEIAQPTS